jgi:hypothetical protein
MNKTERKLLETFDPGYHSMVQELKKNQYEFLRNIKTSSVLIVILMMSLSGYIFTKAVSSNPVVVNYFFFTSLFTTGSLIYLHGEHVSDYHRRRLQIIRYYEQN